jgi:transposase
MDTEIRCFMKPEVVMSRRKFSREFKIEAVKLIRERGVSVAQAGRDLGIHENVLRNWEGVRLRSRSGLSRPWPNEARATGDRAAAARGQQTQGGAGFFKKAAAFFAKEAT